MKLRELLKFKFHSERGASMVEYILLASGIALVAIMGVTNIGEQINATNGPFRGPTQAIQAAGGGGTTTILGPG